MPWKASSGMEERLRFVAHVLVGEPVHRFPLAAITTPQLVNDVTDKPLRCPMQTRFDLVCQKLKRGEAGLMVIRLLVRSTSGSK